MAHSRNSSHFENLRQQCLRLGLYEDKTFPPYHINPAVFGDHGKHVDITWKRPHEIFSDPKFVVDKATRFDLNRGDIGNCWYIAGAATLATRQDLWRKVVPTDQGFGQNYAGIFHFNFWRFGKWEELIIDDKLPTYNGRLCFCSNTDEPNEMWGPLLEKAYAKCYGSYEDLDGGFPEDALVDFTGGIGKRHNLQDPNMDRTKLWEMLLQQLKMNSLFGAAVHGNGEDELSNGLVVKRHAYSIKRVTKVCANGEEHKLLRMQNPLGHQEWDGPWSDSSAQWERIDEYERRRLGLVTEEYWVSYEKLLGHFDEIQTCHLPTENRLQGKRKWNQIQYTGSWNASDNDLSSMHSKNSTNPFYSITLKRPDDGGDDGDGLCTLIISLMQKNRRAGTVIPICFDVHKGTGSNTVEILHRESTPDYSNCRGIPEYYRGLPKFYREFPEYYREITEELRVPPGTYVVIPSTPDKNMERDFLLRFCIEKDADKDYPIREHSVGGPTVTYGHVTDHPVRNQYAYHPVRNYPDGDNYTVMDQYHARDSCCPTCTCTLL